MFLNFNCLSHENKLKQTAFQKKDINNARCYFNRVPVDREDIPEKMEIKENLFVAF